MSFSTGIIDTLSEQRGPINARESRVYIIYIYLEKTYEPSKIGLFYIASTTF